MILLFLFGAVLCVILFTQTADKLNPGYLISSKSFYPLKENKKDTCNPGNKIIAVRLESETSTGKMSIAGINLLLNEALDDICSQIKGTQEEFAGSDIKIQESPAEGSGTDFTDSVTEKIKNENPETSLLLTINNLRKQNGLQILNPNQILINIAYSRSQDMINRGYFSHNTPEGKNIFNILAENGIGYACAGENLYNCTPSSVGTPEAIISYWLGSQNHRANIFSPNYSQVGIKIVDGGNRRVVTAIFLN